MRISTLARKAFLKPICISERVGNKLKKSPLRNFPLGRALVDAVLLPSDVLKIDNSFRTVFGRHPNFLMPKTFNEKLQRSKLTRRRPRYTQYADKVAVRDIVAQTIGEKYLTRLLWHGPSLEGSWRELRQSLPAKFIIKTNQGSGSNIICLDESNFNWTQACERTSQWLQNDHSVPFAEWQYRWINPQVLIEELLLDDDGKIPVDYKLFCFHGKVKYIQVDFDRAENHTRLIFDDKFNCLDVAYQYQRYEDPVSPPVRLGLMIELAEQLSRGEEFIRVDFYMVSAKLVFGELTLHPEAGIGIFNPSDYDSSLGQLL